MDRYINPFQSSANCGQPQQHVAGRWSYQQWKTEDTNEEAMTGVEQSSAMSGVQQHTESSYGGVSAFSTQARGSKRKAWKKRLQ